MRGLSCLLLLITTVGRALADTPAVTNEGVVRLPRFTVTDTRILPKFENWRYASLPGFEILSTASKSATESAVGDFLLFHRAVETIWPLERMNAAVPASLILCGHERDFAPFLTSSAAPYARNTLSASYQDREMASIVVEFDPSAFSDTAPGAGQSGLESYTQDIVHREYVHFLLGRLGARTPAWLTSGLWQLFIRMKYAGDYLQFPALAEEQEGARLPLAQLFTGSDPGSDLEDSAMTPWQRETYEFVHFCLFGGNPAYHQAFLDFALRASIAPPSEALFERSFGTGFAPVEQAFFAYTGFTKNLTLSIVGPNGTKPPPLPKISLRDATDAEVGRIKGETLRMAGHLEAAHLNLIAPYLRGSRDPQLLASLGLEEEAEGHTDRACRFLEAAVADHTARARAYADLAALRLHEALAHPRAPGGRLSVDQLATVLKPLFDGRSIPPALPETYSLIAEAWARAGVKPQPGHLEAVTQGVLLFPYDTDLVCADAKLWGQYGYSSEAKQLCALGLKYAADAGDRARLTALEAAMK